MASLRASDRYQESPLFLLLLIPATNYPPPPYTYDMCTILPLQLISILRLMIMVVFMVVVVMNTSGRGLADPLLNKKQLQ